MKHKHLTAVMPLLVSLLIPITAISASAAKEVEVNGVRLQYVDHGSGEPIVFVHGVPSDLRSWEPVREGFAKKYRFIAYTQRYFGTRPWPDDGKNLTVATLADDLAKFIATLNVGPVHLVGWSYGGQVTTTAAVKNPSLVRSLILYEASVASMLPTDSAEGKAAREDRAKLLAPAIAAAKAGDAVQAAKRLQEAVFQLPPGEFDRLPQDWQTRVLDNARTLPLVFSASPPPVITCDMLKSFARPTLVMHGEKTQAFYALIAEAIGKCVPSAQLVVLPNVGHDGPRRDPAAFTAAVVEFLSSR
ncbi:pimeloyl-ACP methyl ester carboxylesterase [Bradyrhizobium sp. AZCC 1719]|uniref:alpha/beta fold hydrolase n=1 Tax=Bradyrhizobium sp. AZCC 1719 TaxID=3117028 RepID=UPI002FF41ACC